MKLFCMNGHMAKGRVRDNSGKSITYQCVFISGMSNIGEFQCHPLPPPFTPRVCPPPSPLTKSASTASAARRLPPTIHHPPATPSHPEPAHIWWGRATRCSCAYRHPLSGYRRRNLFFSTPIVKAHPRRPEVQC